MIPIWHTHSKSGNGAFPIQNCIYIQNIPIDKTVQKISAKKIVGVKNITHICIYIYIDISHRTNGELMS